MKELDDLHIFKIHADFCAALGNEKRLQILWLLQDGERSVGELATEIGISTPNVSQHLRVLRTQGAVLERKEGQQVYYRIANKKFMQGCRLIRESIIENHLSKSELFKKEQ